MKFSKDTKIEKVASRDISRASLVNPYLDVKGKRLLATDGHTMAVVRVEVGPDDHDGPVTAEALAAARKAVPRGHDDAFLNVNGAQIVPDGPTFPRPAAVSFPPVDAVIPTYGDDAIRVSFNPFLLLRACEAIGVEREASIVLTFTRENDRNTGKPVVLAPIKVECERAAGFAVVMPCRI